MKKTLFAFILFATIFGPTSEVAACSAFSGVSEDGRIVGKNFDWYLGEGMVSVNARGAVRHGLLAVPGTEVPWTARYGSLSFSPIGPGFPISGMNERGLVVEGLHHMDFDGRTGSSDTLISLEWVQSILDRFETVEEVLEFANNGGFTQFALPLHFLVCDKRGDCAVAENRNGRTEMIAGKRLDVKALANNSWTADRRALDQHKSTSVWAAVRNFFTGDAGIGSSARRFQTLARQMRSPFRDTKQIFAALDAARITSMTQWQIIWQQDKSNVTWRSFDGDRPGPATHIDFANLSFRCNASGSLVGEVSASNDFHLATCGEACKNTIRTRTTHIFKMLGTAPPPTFTENLLDASTKLSCL